MCFIASLCVLAVFYFIKPFGLGYLTDTAAAATGLKYGLVTLLLSLFCTTVLPFLFPGLFDEKRWTVLQEMIFLLLMVLIIALGNVWLTTYIFENQLSAVLVINTIKYTLVIAVAPVLLSVLVKQQNLLAKYSREARQMEEHISATRPQPVALIAEAESRAGLPVIVAEVDEKDIPSFANSGAAAPAAPVIATKQQDIAGQLVLKGANQSESLALQPADFLFAAAADNYTSINYLQNGLVKQVLFRLTVKNLAEQTASETQIFRCHKSFLVNLEQVAHISGNAQGYKLHLPQNGLTVPVSRSLNSQIKQKMETLHLKT
jgi:DNA-binding LytR/AlgR family response regulator